MPISNCYTRVMKPVEMIEVPRTNRARGGIRFKGDEVRDFLNTHELGFPVAVRDDYVMPAWERAGDHRHERLEGLLALSAGFELTWKYRTGKKLYTAEMAPTAEHFRLFVIQPWVPHSVFNNSCHDGFLAEYSDMRLEDSAYSRVQVLPPPRQ